MGCDKGGFTLAELGSKQASANLPLYVLKPLQGYTTFPGPSAPSPAPWVTHIDKDPNCVKEENQPAKQAGATWLSSHHKQKIPCVQEGNLLLLRLCSIFQFYK